ncbi:uncharacterized protein LOC126754246 isoform X2 [Bactrocera neohumeralis]|uniref:uncharacterized protein LOC126754246 isoform X2 n=1 Tax=Bactrocera neohumeralis TaxID=98809 RepID=UPI0021655ACB|nr:uncharacterized protein LOC126754246 isoform X2 [Bactrocera neohumeralis]
MASLHATNSCNSNSCSAALTNNKPLTPTKNTVKLLNGKSSSDCGVVAAASTVPSNNNNSSSKSYNNLSNNVEQLFNSALKALHLPQCVGGGTADSGVGGGGGKKSPGKVKTNGENKLTLVVQKCAKNIDIAAAAAADDDDIEYEQHDLAAQEAQPDADSVQLRCACPAVHATSTDASNVNNKNRTMTVTTTFRSSSTSALMTAGHMRPQTLNVHHLRETPSDQTQIFIREVLNAWRAKARCNVVPAERTQELFHELSFHPSEKQITEMLQTAKLLARKGSRQSNGLTFGEFCVLAADLKRFRTSTFSPSICDKVNLLSSLQQENNDNSSRVVEANNGTVCHTATTTATGTELRSTKSLSNVEDCKRKLSKGDTSAPVEVFLGGSCNPTTWRADVAIPALNELGISFYNPQVSDWTPDLIELEHRAKEKARVLFFVMDSETRASAGAIEAAHIAGQNCKQLVLVLHPYKRNQSILNEQISQQEYIDLRRNQLILKELVTRRGLPVMDDIPSGLQRTKDILAGIRDPPSNIATILVVVRGAFDRVNPVNGAITVVQCQRALLYLGYAQSLVKLDNLNKIIATQRETLEALQKRSTKSGAQPELNSSEHATKKSSSATSCSSDTPTHASLNESLDVDFDLFCVISAYLSVLQQEIQESGCISPIKGTNVPPPPVYLTNMQGDESNFAISYFTSKNISRTSSQTSVPGSDERHSSTDLLSRSRDSGTSSPQPLDQPMKSRSAAQLAYPILSAHSTAAAAYPLAQLNASAAQLHSTYPDSSVTAEEESDSNDSVFSSSSSINSVNCNYGGNNEFLTFAGTDFRDVYLGGSCFLRTKWRQDIAMPYLKTKGVTFHPPALHESLQATQLDSSLPDKVYEDARQLGAAQEKSLKRTRRKYRGAALEEEEEEELTVSEETYSWALPPMRPSLYNPALLDASRVLLFVITNETRSLAPMTLAAHCIGLMYNVVLAVQMLPDDCVINNEKLTPAAIKDYNRGRSYLIDLAKRQGVPVFSDLKAALECTVDKIKACNSRGSRYD